jgi:glycosyltransferase involved in cell wall biosynthesis
MSRAVPVVISEIPIFREISAGKGEFSDAESPDSFAQAIRRLEPIDSWQHASQKSLDQSKLYSWEDSAKKLLKVVDSLRG